MSETVYLDGPPLEIDPSKLNDETIFPAEVVKTCEAAYAYIAVASAAFDGKRTEARSRVLAVNIGADSRHKRDCIASAVIALDLYTPGCQLASRMTEELLSLSTLREVGDEVDYANYLVSIYKNIDSRHPQIQAHVADRVVSAVKRIPSNKERYRFATKELVGIADEHSKLHEFELKYKQDGAAERHLDAFKFFRSTAEEIKAEAQNKMAEDIYRGVPSMERGLNWLLSKKLGSCENIPVAVVPPQKKTIKFRLPFTWE